jgi:hypothetical protein
MQSPDVTPFFVFFSSTGPPPLFETSNLFTATHARITLPIFWWQARATGLLARGILHRRAVHHTLGEDAITHAIMGHDSGTDSDHGRSHYTWYRPVLLCVGLDHAQPTATKCRAGVRMTSPDRCCCCCCCEPHGRDRILPARSVVPPGCRACADGTYVNHGSPVLRGRVE